jgi:hypothetical protein
MSNRLQMLACLVVALLLASLGCGSSDSSDVAATSGSAPAVPATPSSPGAPAAPATPSAPAAASASSSSGGVILQGDAARNYADRPGGLSGAATPARRLAIGAPAPALAVEKWVVGEPIAALAPDQIYVIEFWASWNAANRTSLPHMSKLQQQYAEKAHFIGITEEPADVVDEFLASEQSPGTTWKSLITHRLAIDNAGQMNREYMEAAGVTATATAFIVGRQGNIEWIGPSMAVEAPLAQVVAGTWDRAAAAAQLEKAALVQPLALELNQMIQSQRWRDALPKIDEIEKITGDNPQVKAARATILNAIAWGIAAEGAAGSLDEAETMGLRASQLTNHSEPNILDTVARVYYEKGDLDKAIEWQKKSIEHDTTNDPEFKANLQKFEAEKAAKSAAPAAAAASPESAPASPQAPAPQ